MQYGVKVLKALKNSGILSYLLQRHIIYQERIKIRSQFWSRSESQAFQGEWCRRSNIDSFGILSYARTSVHFKSFGKFTQPGPLGLWGVALKLIVQISSIPRLWTEEWPFQTLGAQKTLKHIWHLVSFIVLHQPIVLQGQYKWYINIWR